MFCEICELRFSDERRWSDWPMSTGESEGFVSFLPVEACICRSDIWLKLDCRYWIAF
jgi:hypothetical protein